MTDDPPWPGVIDDKITLPEFSARRGGIQFPQPGSPAWERLEADRSAQEAIATMVHRVVGDVVALQEYVIGQALSEAIEQGWAVRVLRPPTGHGYQLRDAKLVPYRYIGITLDPDGRPGTIYEEQASSRWLDWDDDD